MPARKTSTKKTTTKSSKKTTKAAKSGKTTKASKSAAGSKKTTKRAKSTKKTTKAKAPVKPTASAPEPADWSDSDLQPQILLTHDDIARRAYEIWERRGKPQGQDSIIWHQAETELWAESKS
jgi:hypothetical protein